MLDRRKRNPIDAGAHLDTRRQSNKTIAGFVPASASPRAPQRRPITPFVIGQRMASR
jgi:hypothetical protein